MVPPVALEESEPVEFPVTNTNAEPSIDLLNTTALPSSPSSSEDEFSLVPENSSPVGAGLHVAAGTWFQAAAPSGRLISVAGDVSSLDVGYMEMYFDSRKASGGGGVEAVHVVSASVGYVVFEDFECKFSW